VLGHMRGTCTRMLFVHRFADADGPSAKRRRLAQVDASALATLLVDGVGTGATC